MKYLKTYKVFESSDMKFNDRDMTNKYHCKSGWIRYSDTYKDSYIDIEDNFDISFDHLGWVLEDLVNICDLLYICSIRDSGGLPKDAQDYGKFGPSADSIFIDLIPADFKYGSFMNYGVYMSKFSHFPPKEEDVLYKLLQEIEDKLDDFHLTIKNEDGQWNLFINTSQMRLKIIRK